MTHPIAETTDGGHLDVGDGHRVHWEVSGHPVGKPAVVLHGGPGSGSAPWWRGFLDPDRYRIVQVDQRGCGRSTPSAGDDVRAPTAITTPHLVGDLELVRQHLGVERWLVLGGSWGSTLGLAYAVAHPDRVSELVLWGVVTTRARDVDWVTRVMGGVYPAAYDELLAVLPEGARDGNVALAVSRLVADPDPAVHRSAADAWCAWEDRLATLDGPVVPDPRFADPCFRLGFARLVTHYFGHHAFLADDAIVGHLDRLAGIPTYLVRGRLDIASPLRSAYDVAQGIPGARLDVVEGEGHGPGPETTARLVAVLDAWAG